MAEDMRRQVARKLSDLLGAPEVYGLIGSLSGVGVLAEQSADVVLDVVAHAGESRLVDHLSRQLDATRVELERARRELWFEVNGSRTFAGADARVARGERIAPFVETLSPPQCSVHTDTAPGVLPEGGTPDA